MPPTKLIACLVVPTAVVAAKSVTFFATEESSLTGAGGSSVAASAQSAFDVKLNVDAAKTLGEVRPIWRFFGYDEANYTFAPDGKKLLSDIASLTPQPAHIRTHHLLTSGDGSVWLKWSSTNAYTEDAQGKPIYNWTILDRIFDTFRERGLKPFVELGFMPEALSVNPQNYTPPKVLSGRPLNSVGGGAFYPPKDYAKWEALVEAWAKHCVERYGQAEAESWFWELWNEPDIAYWRGTPQDYNCLYDHTAAAVKRVLPNARFGGPHLTSPGRTNEPFLRQFIEHCLRGTNAATGGVGAPLDFIAFHAKGGTEFVNGHVRMNMGNQLRAINRGCSIVASYPELKGKPVIIGESDPDGCAACSARFFPQNGYRNGAHYASYTAATFMRKQAIAERHGVLLEGAVTWAFEFEDQPWFDGFRVLATHGIALPVFNTFRTFSRLERQRVAVESSAGRSLDDLIRSSVRDRPDVDAFASCGERALTVLAWHYHDEGVPGPEAKVELNCAGLPANVRTAKLTHYRIDDDHSNAHTAWLKMGSPQNPTPEQYAALQKASELTLLEPSRTVEVQDSRVSLSFSMPRQSVSLISLEW